MDLCDVPKTKVRKRSSIKSLWDKNSESEKKLLITLTVAVLLLNAFLFFTAIEIAEMTRGSGNKQSSIKKHILISLIIAVSTLIGCLLYWVIKLAMSQKSCTAPGCLVAAAQIVTHIDPATDPCEDFFKFACGNYLHNTYGSVNADPIETLEELVKNQVEDIIKTPINDDDHYLVKIQKEFVRACMNETAVEEESLDVLKEMLEELNGWPVVVGRQWNQSLFDWKGMIHKLRQKGYFHLMMLTIGPVVDPRNESQYIIRVEQPFVHFRAKSKKEHYKTYMTEVAVMMGAERNFAETEMEKVLDFAGRLKLIGKKNKWKVENVNETNVNVTAEILSTTFTVEEFQKLNNEIDWLDFINSILYPSATISGDDYVIFPTNEFLEAFFSLISKAPKRTQANYIIWSVIETCMPFMSKELQKIREHYMFQTHGPSCPEDRFEFCTDRMRRIVYPQPTDLLYLRKYLTIEKREKVQKLFRSVKSEFISLLKKTSWMDDESKERTLERAHEISEIIGAMGDYFDDAAFDEYAFTKEKDFQTDSFFKMYLSRSKDQTDERYSLIRKSTVSSKLGIHQNMVTIVNAIYFPEENSIFIPAGILQGNFYGDDRPMYLNYGAIGSIMGHELTHGFCKAANEYNKDKNSTTIWTVETEEAYEETSKCVVQNAEDFEIENVENKINGTQTLEENIADYTGLKVSYAAYKKWVRDNGEEPQLPGIEYTPYQLFWISAVALHCYQLKPDEFQTRLEYDNHALNVFRATGPLRNNPDFVKDFNCPLGSKMNPPEKCQIF